MARNSYSNIVPLDTADICSVCGKKSECKCDRCGDYYCSEDCQRKDWPYHRFICLPMPKLVKCGQTPITSDNSQVQLATKDGKSRVNNLPNGSCVILTGFRSSNRCFIRSTNPSICAEHEKVLNEINEFGNKSPPLNEKPKLKSHAFALKNGKWYRVEILGQSKENFFRVSFIDSGEISERSFKELRKMEPSLVNLPCYIRNVQLKGVKLISDKSLVKSLVQYTNKEYKVEFVKADKYGGTVELFQWGSSILLNSLIQDLFNKHKDSKGNDINDDKSISSSSSHGEVHKNGLPDKKSIDIKMKQRNDTTNKIQTISKVNVNENTKEKMCDPKRSMLEQNKSTNGVLSDHPEDNIKNSAPRQIQMLKPCLVPPFDIIPLKENEGSSKIMIMDCSYIESGYIGCLSENYFENLKAISKFLSEYDVGEKPYTPKFNEYCLANYENEWYRAKVVEVLSENKFLVVYIDFTNEMELTSEAIRHYPMSLTLPCCTTLCVIDGLPEDISDEQKKFLESNCAPFQPFNIDRVRVCENVRYVKSNELLNKMRDSKLF